MSRKWCWGRWRCIMFSVFPMTEPDRRSYTRHVERRYAIAMNNVFLSHVTSVCEWAFPSFFRLLSPSPPRASSSVTPPSSGSSGSRRPTSRSWPTTLQHGNVDQSLMWTVIKNVKDKINYPKYDHFDGLRNLSELSRFLTYFIFLAWGQIYW